MKRLFAAIALLACFACSKSEMDINNAINESESGVYVHFAPIVEDDTPTTRGYSSPNWAYNVEINDRINIWSAAGSLQIFKVVQTEKTEKGNFVAKIESSGFELTDGETYYATFPFILNNVERDHTDQAFTYEGQTQTDQNGTELRELGKYVYNYASATSNNGNTNFSFNHFSTFFRVIATLPRENMTISEISVTADKPVFALNGTFDLTTGTLTAPAENYSNTLKMTLNNLTVNGKVVTAYFASNPLEAATYVISVKDSDKKVYTSPEISKGARAAGGATKFEVTVESEEREYVKVTSLNDDDFDGQYILVYPNGTNYRVFSFLQAMENAEDAAESVANVSGLDNLLKQGSSLYKTVIANDCIDVEGEANATTLILTPEQEKAAAITVTTNGTDNSWDVIDGKVELSATTESGNTYTIPVDHTLLNFNGDAADIVTVFNAPGIVNTLNSLRGHTIDLDFGYLIDFAVSQANKEGVEFTNAEIDRLKTGFEHLCDLAKTMVAQHPELFGSGNLMDIDLSTNALSVFSQYYDNAAQLSLNLSYEKRFGLATLGYHAYDQGFTFNIGMPQSGWFDRLNASLTTDSDHNGELTKADCIAYWAQFDNQYNIQNIESFFERAARRALSEVSDDTFAMLQAMAAAHKFTAIGKVYKNYVDRFNDQLETVYIYKKVE